MWAATLTMQQTLAGMQGRVFDASGAVPGASIRAQNRATGFDASVRTDSDGRYYLAAMPAGEYSLF